MMEKNPFLSIIISAHNQAEKLPLALVDADKYLSQQNFSYEIIAVNNGSTDNTKEIIKKFAVLIKNLKLVDNPNYRGDGDGVRRGMLATKGRWRVRLNVDRASFVNEFDKFAPFLAGGRVGVLIGSRQPAAISEKILSRWCGALSLIKKVQDVRCGFQCFSGEAADKICALSQTNHWGFDIEMLSLAQGLGYKIKEVPVRGRFGRENKTSVVDYWKILCQTLKIKNHIKQCLKNTT